MRFSPLTIGLGVTMTIGYGTLYYSFSVLAPEIAQEFGWGESFIFGIFSVGLLAGASVAAPLGRLADRFGARLVLSLGSLAAAAVLALLGLMQNAGHFILLALAGECIALAVQYEAGFAALAQIHGVLPLHYFGAAGCGRRTGSLASVRIIVSALAPFTIIWLNETWGSGAAIAAILAVALVSVAAILALVMTERPAKRPSMSSPSGIASVLDNPAKSKS